MAFTWGGSWVDICNRALSRLGTGTIQSLDSENVNVENARYCSLFLGEAIEEVYAQWDWKSATQTVTLARLATPPTGHKYAYQLPSGFIRAVQVDAGGAPYVFAGETIQTDAETVELTYIARPDDPAKIPPHLRKAISTTLAFLLTTPLTTNDLLAQRIFQEAQIALTSAKIQDQAGSYEEPLVERVWHDEAR